MKNLLDTKNLKKAVSILLLTTLSITFTSSNLFAGKRIPKDLPPTSPLHTRTGAQYGSKRKRTSSSSSSSSTQTHETPGICKKTPQDKVKANAKTLLELLKQKKLLEEKNQNKRNQDELLDLIIIQNLMGDLERYKDTNVSTLETVLSYSLNKLTGKENLETTKIAIENILANLQKIEDKDTQISINIQIPKPEVFEQNQEITVQTSGVLGWVKRHPVLTTGIVVGVVVAGVTVAYFTIPAAHTLINSASHKAGTWGARKLADLTGLTQEHQVQVKQLETQLSQTQEQLIGANQDAHSYWQQFNNATSEAPTYIPQPTCTQTLGINITPGDNMVGKIGAFANGCQSVAKIIWSQ